jgi:hypothetical protein
VKRGGGYEAKGGRKVVELFLGEPSSVGSSGTQTVLTRIETSSVTGASARCSSTAGQVSEPGLEGGLARNRRAESREKETGQRGREVELEGEWIG